MTAQTFPAAYANKSISVKFRGRESVFQLSHGLFSSFELDAGTRLLLKCLAQRVDLASLESILDLGCGVGVIGICCASASPGARVVLQDRDALAAAFARENCRANGLAKAEIDCGLAFWHLEGRTFDLVASNLPAKAGKPVLESFFQTVPHVLSSAGTAIVVIVSPLEQLARDAVSAVGCRILNEEKTQQHVVLHFGAAEGKAPTSTPPASRDLSPYLRTRASFSAGRASYSLDTAYNLPDFDTIGYATELAQDVLAEAKVRGDVLFWNPGQGHLPVFLQTAHGRSINAFHLASRDSLELEVSTRNLSAVGRAVTSVSTVPCEASLPECCAPGSFDFLLALPHPIPKAPWQQDLAEAATALLRQGGAMLVAGSSTDVHRILYHAGKLTVLDSRKKLGCRAVLMKLS